jgi:hypothetical protein
MAYKLAGFPYRKEAYFFALLLPFADSHHRSPIATAHHGVLLMGLLCLCLLFLHLGKALGFVCPKGSRFVPSAGAPHPQHNLTALVERQSKRVMFHSCPHHSSTIASDL